MERVIKNILEKSLRRTYKINNVKSSLIFVLYLFKALIRKDELGTVVLAWYL